MALLNLFSLSLFAVVVLLFVALGVLIWLWGAFLDKHEHDPARVRAFMFLFLSLATTSEIALFAWGKTHAVAVWISIIVNLWGGLDALLRFPAAHDMESFFSMKQFLLLVVKTFTYAFGMISLKKDVAAFLAVLLINIWGLPVLYTMALPMDPAEQVVKDDSYDVDLAVRVWQLASCSSERQQCLVTCKGWWYRNLTKASESSSLARLAICVASPEHRRAFKKMGRSV